MLKEDFVRFLGGNGVSICHFDDAEELERRRAIVAEGKSGILTEEESWERIRAAGYDV